MIIGITGGIASGKSTISNILEERSFVRIDADGIAKDLMEPGRPAYQGVVDYFGESILKGDSTIDRNKLGEIVFGDKAKLQRLNELTHKFVCQEIIRLLEVYKSRGSNIVLDVVLLYESGLDRLADEVWYVEASRDERLRRLMHRNGFTKVEAEKRIDVQEIFKNKGKADRIIYNNGDFVDLERQVLKYLGSEG